MKIIWNLRNFSYYCFEFIKKCANYAKITLCKISRFARVWDRSVQLLNQDGDFSKIVPQIFVKFPLVAKKAISGPPFIRK